MRGLISFAPTTPILSELVNVLYNASYHPSHTKISASTNVIISPMHCSTAILRALGYCKFWSYFRYLHRKFGISTSNSALFTLLPIIKISTSPGVVFKTRLRQNSNISLFLWYVIIIDSFIDFLLCYVCVSWAFNW